MSFYEKLSFDWSFFRLNNLYTRYHIGIFLSIVGFLLWLYVILGPTVYWINTNYEFGLFQQLPIFYWLSLFASVAGTLLLLENQSHRIFLCQMLVLALIIWGTPIFVENNARITDAWLYLGTTKTVMDSGRITVNSSSTHSYLQWPGSFVFSSIILLVSGLPSEPYLRIFPLISSLIFILGYYILVREIVDNRIVQKISVIALLFLNLWLQFHLSPQAFGLMLFPLVLVCIMKGTGKWSLIGIVLFISLVLSHPESPFFIVLLSFAGVFLLFMQKKVTKFQNSFFLFLVWLVWFAFAASSRFDLQILGIKTAFLDVGRPSNASATLFTAKTSYAPSLIRFIVIVCTMVIALLQILLSRKQVNPRKFTLYVGWIIAVFLFFSLDLFFGSSTLQDRAFMFAFLLVPILVMEFAWRITKARLDMRIVAGILLLLLLPNLLTLYYAENGAIVSNSNIAMVLHLNKYFSSGTLYGSQHCDVIFAFNTSYQYAPLYYYDKDTLPVNSFIVFDEYTMQTPSAPASSTLKYLHNLCSEQVGANLLYSNGKFEVYHTAPSG